MVSRTGPLTRPQLSSALAFSKPTMSAAVGELEAQGLLASSGVAKGAVGRTAITYGLGVGAGCVVGVDCGTTQVRAMLSKLDGTERRELKQAVDDREPEALDGDDGRFSAVLTILRALMNERSITMGPLRAIAVALPNIISSSLDKLPAREPFLRMLNALQAEFRVPILVENNVNCAALAEFHEGAARDHSFAIYMQIGVKVGVGIVLDGKLFRGFRGAAGEIGHLPFPWSETERPRWQYVESYLGSNALLKRCTAEWPTGEGNPPSTAADLFLLAETSQHARACVERHAANIGNLAAACVSVLDPELIVLGGGVGQNALLLTGVKAVIQDLCWPVEIAVSQLANQATVLGAMRLAIDYTMASLLQEDSSAAFLLPVNG
ncbi:ROK family transcriptional regulator [Rhizobium sp. CFBP 8762]|nr:ROK family transcriptional regulator [Rhizobium sp. CFBP 8762]